MKTKIFLLSVSLLAFSLSEPLASMASERDSEGFIQASAYADLDWEHLVVTGNITPYSDYYYSLSQAGTGEFWYTGSLPLEDTWVTDYKNPGHVTTAVSSLVTSNGFAQSEAETDATWMYSSSGASLFDGGSVGANSAWARAAKAQAYSVNADGDVSFTIPYEVLLNVQGGEISDEYAAAWAWSWLRLWNGSDWAVIDGTYVDATTDGKADLIVNYKNATAGSYIMFEAGSDTIASIVNPVPVPPSVLMLLTGCTSLFFMRRRKS